MVIVAAVDNSDRDADVVREGVSLSSAFGDTLHVVHVMTRSEFVDAGRSGVERNDPIDMDQVRKYAADIAGDVVAAAVSDDDVSIETVGVMGDPVSRIVDYADDHEARFVVIGGRKRSPTGKALFGSIAQSILLNATCPVVSARKS